ncbi:MAG: transposase [Lachnospiraceae bacterium]|nr:transposase [Lachnospiraceae bacterium]
MLKKWTHLVNTHYNKLDTKRRYLNKSTNKRGNRCDEEFTGTLVNLYQNSNKSQTAICKEYGVSTTALDRWIKHYSTVEVDDGTLGMMTPNEKDKLYWNRLRLLFSDIFLQKTCPLS